MYLDDFAAMYGFDVNQIEAFIADAGFEIKPSFTRKTIRDSDVGPIVNGFHRHLEQQAEKQKAMASILITSGFGFDGYTIKKYSGYISGDDAVQVDRGKIGLFSQGTDVSSALMSSIVHIRRNALAELKEAAYELGCNAVIGVDFDYLTLEPETVGTAGQTVYLPYVFGVTANGNAVVIEKDSPGN
ncbi:heavy metal-binding domain-containing protein [Raoultibacter phocaeensis]|uniref:heavy metal-binding domain-containing protein n=1 Tax=Raoultibacter phocaeensis TaxID=2479841 RepID=UPI0015D58FFA|nr:heavy metal-binding domain-containing protein [Raoultibacter phocaeensis]